jgi:uncharacterized protein YdeI (YjbR/CyaY-like superfamily)
MVETVYFPDRTGWREWLSENHDRKSEIWLILPKLSSGEKKIPYNDSVEEALCFGWIDSTHRPYDEHHTIQRFTPRRKGSPYSQWNIERLRHLSREGLLLPEVEESVRDILQKEFIFPEDILKELRKDPIVWNNFQAFSDPYKRIRIAYIDDARDRPDEFQKRLKNFINKTRDNKIIGYGGIEKYY